MSQRIWWRSTLLKKRIYKYTKKKKTEYKNPFIEQLSHARDSSTFWKIINKFRYKPQSPDHIGLKEWFDYFQTTFPPNREIPHPIMNFSNPQLDAEITRREISWSLKKCKENKSPGPDEIPYEFFKYLPEEGINHLTILFNIITNSEKIPVSWSQSLLRMLHKKGVKSDPANYRPIALMNCIGKIFMQILTERLGTWLESENLLPEWQAGFRKKRSCIDNIFVLNYIIQARLSREGGKLFALFVDFRSAFPSVSHGLLWTKLYKLGVGSKMINLLISLYEKANVAVKNSSGISKQTKVTKGVLQGEVMSPLLFACFIADLEDFLREKGSEASL